MPSGSTILLPLFRDDIAPRFDLASELLLVSLDAEGRERERSTILLAHPSADEACRIALEEKVRLVIVNGIEEEYYQYLRWKRVEVLDNVMGPAEAVLDRYLRGALRPGDNLFGEERP